MNIVVTTCPIRPVPDTYPPIGALSIMNYVRKRGFSDIQLYDIDAFRPDYEDVLRYFREQRPDVIAISAVVSTAYGYTKRLSLDIKKILPDSTIILGGNLAASAEILLCKTGVDFCAIGEGEVTFLKFLERCKTTRRKEDFKDIPGLTYISGSGELINTGFEKALPGDAIYDVDWDDLDRYSRPQIYVYPAFDEQHGLIWAQCGFEERVFEPHRRNKNVGTLAVGKGCVARCTFCHRFDKGIVHIPPAIVIERLKEMIDRYNVGFIDLQIESFGSDKRWLTEFCRLIKPLDVIWRAPGVRCRSVNPEIIAMVKDAGCVHFTYGFESGSQRMLDIMEKKTPIKMNYDAAQWTLEGGLYTVAQFVVGMPGETNDTIKESCDFTRFVYTRVPWLKPSNISINYAQALPGTPLYEIARQHGQIGTTLESEEQYLLDISDQNASETVTTINFTDSPTLEWRSWQSRIVASASIAYLRKYGLDALVRVNNGDDPFPMKGGQAWTQRARFTPLTPTELRRLKIKYLLTGLPRSLVHSTPILGTLATLRLALYDERRRRGHKLGAAAVPYASRLLYDWIAWKIASVWRQNRVTYESLRKTLEEKYEPITTDSPAMQALRNGR